MIVESVKNPPCNGYTESWIEHSYRLEVLLYGPFYKRAHGPVGSFTCPGYIRHREFLPVSRGYIFVFLQS